MIDSIELELHNLQNYPDLLRYFKNNIQSEIRENVVESNPNDSDRKLLQRVREYRTSFNGKKNMSVWASGKVLTSSHYNLGFSLPFGKDSTSIKFNFSIPKLIYGTNIMQFVQHRTERRANPRFSMMHNTKSQYNAEQTYDRLISFLSNFFYRLNGYKHIDFRDLIIKRIDICQMQMFRTKEDALRYLGYQRNILKKHTRENSLKPRSFGSTIFFSTREYGAKIYHKGEEYRCSTGERKEHKRINREEKRKVFDTEFLSQFADRCLRYEVTFRNTMLSKLYRNKVFRKNELRHQGLMTKYKMLNRIYKYSTSNDLSIEKLNHYQDVWNGERVEILKCNYCKAHGYEGLLQNNSLCKCERKHIPVSYRKKDGTKITITKSDRDFYYWWSKVKERKIEFSLGVSRDIDDLNSGNLVLEDKNDGRDYIPSQAKFSRALLKECFKVFFDFKNEFKINERTSFTQAQIKADRHNEHAEQFNKKMGFDKPVKYLTDREKRLKKKKVSVITLKRISALQQQYTTKQMLQYGMISRSTYTRYERKLKDLEINFRNGSDVSIKSNRSFEWYHHAMLNHDLSYYTINNYFR